MKLLITGDIHLKDWKDNEFVGHTPLKVKEILSTFNDMCKYAKKNNISNVIIAGDINDTKAVVSVNAFVLFRKILSLHKELDFYIIPGNHDISNKGNRETAVDLLKGPTNVHVISEPKTIFNNIFIVPFSESMFAHINEYKGTCDILVSHFGISDALYSSGITGKSKISSKDLKTWKLVILGDYHKPQSVNNVTYVGSPIPLTRGEAGEEKRFLVIDNESYEIESIPTVGYRKYIEIIIESDSDINNINNIIRENREAGNFIVVKKKVKDLDEAFIELDYVQIVDLYEEEYQTRGISSFMDLESQMIKFMEINNIKETDRSNYMEIGLDIIRDDEIDG